MYDACVASLHQKDLTHCGRVMPPCIIEFGQHLLMVMACCFMAPSHYLDPYTDFSSVRSCGFHLMAISHKMLTVFIFESKSNFQTDIKFWHQLENYFSKITAPSRCKQWVNSLWPSDTIWRHKSGSTLDQVMACCLMAPSHYLNQCWLIISKVQWHSSECNFTRDTSAISHWNYLENDLFKSPRGQWLIDWLILLFTRVEGTQKSNAYLAGTRYMV